MPGRSEPTPKTMTPRSFARGGTGGTGPKSGWDSRESDRQPTADKTNTTAAAKAHAVQRATRPQNGHSVVMTRRSVRTYRRRSLGDGYRRGLAEVGRDLEARDCLAEFAPRPLGGSRPVTGPAARTASSPSKRRTHRPPSSNQLRPPACSLRPTERNAVASHRNR